MTPDEVWMGEALAEARRAAASGEVPVGAIAVCGGVLIARAANRVEAGHDATCHAEIELLKACSRLRGDWRMEDVEIFVTKEPCAMCAGAMVNARVKRVVFGMAAPRSGGCGSALNITGFSGMLWQVETSGGVLADECSALFREFFREVRQRGK